MATRSLIGVKQPDGTVKVVYCHWDGNLNGVGQTLASHYATDELANALVAGGDMSSLGKDLASTVFYSLRGEFAPATTEKDTQGYLSRANTVWHEWLYLWDGKMWLYAKTSGKKYGDWKKIPKNA